MKEIVTLVGSERDREIFLLPEHEETLLGLCTPEFRDDPHHPVSVHITSVVMHEDRVKSLKTIWKWRIPEDLHDLAIDIIQCVMRSHRLRWQDQNALAGWLFTLMVEWHDHYPIY